METLPILALASSLIALVGVAYLWSSVKRLQDEKTVKDINVNFPLTDKQKTDIQECLKKGSIRLESKGIDVSVLKGKDKYTNGYLWD